MIYNLVGNYHFVIVQNKNILMISHTMKNAKVALIVIVKLALIIHNVKHVLKLIIYQESYHNVIVQISLLKLINNFVNVIISIDNIF